MQRPHAMVMVVPFFVLMVHHILRMEILGMDIIITLEHPGADRHTMEANMDIHTIQMVED